MTARPPLADTVRLPTACALDCTAMPSSPATVSRAMMEKVPSGGSSQAMADGDKSANKSARTSLSFMARKPGLATEQRDIAYRAWHRATIGDLTLVAYRSGPTKLILSRRSRLIPPESRHNSGRALSSGQEATLIHFLREQVDIG